MVLLAIVGGLGSGKTLSLTYLAWRNWKLKGRKIYSNYWLTFPHKRIQKISDLEEMENGFFAGDELWLWIDSRIAVSKRNRVVSTILLQSRKKDVHFAYTTQSFSQVDSRIRRCTDFIAVPMLTPREDWCRLVIMTYPAMERVKIYKFPTAPVFNMYNTREVVKQIDYDDEE